MGLANTQSNSVYSCGQFFFLEIYIFSEKYKNNYKGQIDNGPTWNNYWEENENQKELKLIYFNHGIPKMADGTVC